MVEKKKEITEQFKRIKGLNQRGENSSCSEKEALKGVQGIRKKDVFKI